MNSRQFRTTCVPGVAQRVPRLRLVRTAEHHQPLTPSHPTVLVLDLQHGHHHFHLDWPLLPATHPHLPPPPRRLTRHPRVGTLEHRPTGTATRLGGRTLFRRVTDQGATRHVQ